MTDYENSRRSKRLQAMAEKSSSASPKKERERRKKQPELINEKDAEADNHDVDNKKNKKKSKKNKKKSIRLSAAEKNIYQRLEMVGDDNSNNICNDPLSRSHLIQENYAYDPWKLLIVCILLNRTDGHKVQKILSNLFKMCPNAETATKVRQSEIKHRIYSLGLQRTRARTITKFSRDYLSSNWTHITQLHGICKFATDSYAMFCAGKPEEVIPNNPKLIEYYKFICRKNDAEFSGNEKVVCSTSGG